MLDSSAIGTLPKTFILSSRTSAPFVPSKPSSMVPMVLRSASLSVALVGRGAAGRMPGAVPTGAPGRTGARVVLFIIGRRIDCDVSTDDNSNFACSTVIRERSALWISFFASSSTSLPSGARVTKSISATLNKSRKMRFPPRSPSTKTTVSLRCESSITVCGTDVPFIAMTFLNPYLSKLTTSARPSTMMSSSASSMPGPAGSRSFPYSQTSMTRIACETSSASSVLSGITVSTMLRRSCFARSMTCVLLLMRTSSIVCTRTFALQGPILWMTSSAAATIAVSALSSELGMMICPMLFPPLTSMLTSILPIRPERCSSRSSSSSPRSPSVCPKIAPMTSGRSTTPSISMLLLTIYLDDTGLIFPI